MRIVDPVSAPDEEYWLGRHFPWHARNAVDAWYPMSSGFESNGYGLIHLTEHSPTAPMPQGNNAASIAAMRRSQSRRACFRQSRFSMTSSPNGEGSPRLPRWQCSARFPSRHLSRISRKADSSRLRRCSALDAARLRQYKVVFFLSRYAFRESGNLLKEHVENRGTIVAEPGSSGTMSGDTPALLSGFRPGSRLRWRRVLIRSRREAEDRRPRPPICPAFQRPDASWSSLRRATGSF